VSLFALPALIIGVAFAHRLKESERVNPMTFPFTMALTIMPAGYLLRARHWTPAIDSAAIDRPLLRCPIQRPLNTGLLLSRKARGPSFPSSDSNTGMP
jgi:hypothetical protein